MGSALKLVLTFASQDSLKMIVGTLERLILIMTFYFLLTVKNFQQCIQFGANFGSEIVSLQNSFSTKYLQNETSAFE